MTRNEKGVLVYNESFIHIHSMTFNLIWSGLALIVLMQPAVIAS